MHVYGVLTIRNALFTYMLGAGIYLKYNSSQSYYHSSHGQPNITIADTLFDSNVCQIHTDRPCAIKIIILKQQSQVRVHIVDVTIKNNTKNVSAISAWCFSAFPNHIILERYNYLNNHFVGQVHPNKLYGSDFTYVFAPQEAGNTKDPVVIEIIDSNFVGNWFVTDQSIDLFNIDSDLYSILFFYINKYYIHQHNISI